MKRMSNFIENRGLKDYDSIIKVGDEYNTHMMKGQKQPAKESSESAKKLLEMVIKFQI